MYENSRLFRKAAIFLCVVDFGSGWWAGGGVAKAKHQLQRVRDVECIHLLELISTYPINFALSFL
jgi:hypothetical protein